MNLIQATKIASLATCKLDGRYKNSGILVKPVGKDVVHVVGTDGKRIHICRVDMPAHGLDKSHIFPPTKRGYTHIMNMGSVRVGVQKNGAMYQETGTDKPFPPYVDIIPSQSGFNSYASVLDLHPQHIVDVHKARDILLTKMSTSLVMWKDINNTIYSQCGLLIIIANQDLTRRDTAFRSWEWARETK